MMHQHTDQSSAQGTNNSISKLISAPESGNANIALQPGTPFLLQGCMCQEGDGVIVVKVNWRDKTYTGSLMDMEQYPWATPKHVEIAELGSPLDKKHRFSPRLLSNQTKQTAISQELQEHQHKDNDVVMSPQSSLVESEEGRSPDNSKQILPKLNNCTELNKMTSFMDMGGFRSKQTLGLLSSPSNSLTDLKAESEKKKNHDMHTGMAHPKEVVIQNILGDGNVLPFDTSNRDKMKFEIHVKEELREDLPSRQMLTSSTKRTPDVLLSKPIDQPKKEGFAPARPMMAQIPFSTLSSLPQTLTNTTHLDPKHKLVKPIAEKQFANLVDQLHHFSGTERLHKSESISPKSSAPDSPNDHKPLKRKHENNHDNSIPKRPDSLFINNNPDHVLNYLTPDKMSIRLDDTTNIRSHIPVNKSSSASHQPLPSSPSTHTPKHHTDRRYLPAEYLITNDAIFSQKLPRDNVKERQDKHTLYSTPQVVPHSFSSNPHKIVRTEKKPKRTREGQSPSDHNMDVSKGNHPAFLPAPSDTKIGSLTAPNVKIEPQPQPHYITPEMLPYYFPPLYLQGAAGMPTIPTYADQQKLLQANLHEVKIENDKAKQKTSNTHKSKSQPKVQQPLLDFNYFQQHSVPINSQIMAQNHIALMMNPNLPLSISKDSGVSGVMPIPGYPVMVEQDKDKMRQSLSQSMKQKVTTPSSHPNSNSNRRLIEKSSNHDTQEELMQNSYTQELLKLNAQQQQQQQQHLKHQEMNSNIEQNTNNAINLAQAFKHKSLATTINNNKLTNSNSALAVLNSNAQAKNGLYPFPFVVTPDLQQMSLFPNLPFPPSIDPSIHLQMPFYDPTVAMRLSQAHVQPDTLDSK